MDSGAIGGSSPTFPAQHHPYMNIKSARELMEAIIHKYGASNVEHELYATKRYHIKWLTIPLVEQSHEIQIICRCFDPRVLTN